MLGGMTGRKRRSVSPNRYFVEFRQLLQSLLSSVPIIAFYWNCTFHHREYPSADIIIHLDADASAPQAAAVMTALEGDFFEGIDNTAVAVTSSRGAFDVMVCQRIADLQHVK